MWGGPARVWPVEVGPNAATLQACFDTINKYYSVNHQPEYIQLVTLDDDDEGTNMETPKGDTNKWFSPDPPVIVSSQVTVTTVVVDTYSDGSTTTVTTVS